jgi:hypothetical protein
MTGLGGWLRPAQQRPSGWNAVSGRSWQDEKCSRKLKNRLVAPHGCRLCGHSRVQLLASVSIFRHWQGGDAGKCTGTSGPNPSRMRRPSKQKGARIHDSGEAVAMAVALAFQAVADDTGHCPLVPTVLAFWRGRGRCPLVLTVFAFWRGLGRCPLVPTVFAFWRGCGRFSLVSTVFTFWGGRCRCPLVPIVSAFRRGRGHCSDRVRIPATRRLWPSSSCFDHVYILARLRQWLFFSCSDSPDRVCIPARLWPLSPC